MAEQRYGYAVYIIKPEAMGSRQRIRRDLIKQFRIVGRKLASLRANHIDQLYDRLSPRLMLLSRAKLGPRRVEVGVVWGRNAPERLAAIRGAHTDPRRCSRKSVRFRFGRTEPTRINKVNYFENGFHASIDAIEALRNRRLYISLR